MPASLWMDGTVVECSRMLHSQRWIHARLCHAGLSSNIFLSGVIKVVDGCPFRFLVCYSIDQNTKKKWKFNREGPLTSCRLKRKKC